MLSDYRIRSVTFQLPFRFNRLRAFSLPQSLGFEPFGYRPTITTYEEHFASTCRIDVHGGRSTIENCKSILSDRALHAIFSEASLRSRFRLSPFGP